jgi:hypothetical protein
MTFVPARFFESQLTIQGSSLNLDGYTYSRLKFFLPASLMPDTVPDIHLLQASVDSEEEDQSDFRILVDHKSIKYLIIDPGLYNTRDMCFGPPLISMLPSLPPGDWNTGYISRNPANGCPHFARVTKAELPGVTHLWHPLRVDYMDLHMGNKLRSNVYEATSPRFPSTIIAKFALFSWQVLYLDAETRAYQWIESQSIGPKFLGHISEDGRAIGFITEKVVDGRHATPDDLSLCQTILSRLHRLGIKHGDVNKHNSRWKSDTD